MDFIPPVPARIPNLMGSFIAGLPEARAKHHPVEFAAIAHMELVTIHPFIDGNDRAVADESCLDSSRLSFGYYSVDPAAGLTVHPEQDP